jgi:gliding motility-associated protein GldE
LDYLSDHILSNLFGLTLLQVQSQASIFLIVPLFFCLLICFFLSGAEVALFSLNYKDMNMLKTRPHPEHKRIIGLLEEPKPLLVSIIITKTFFKIVVVILANSLIDRLYIDRLFPVHQLSWMLELVVKIIIITMLLMLFGEVLPKAWATQNNIRFAYASAWMVEIVHKAMKGISTSIAGYTDKIEKKLGTNQYKQFSLEELDHAIDNIELRGEADNSEEEKNILKGIVKFGRITVKQIMRSRLDVAGIDYNISFTALKAKIEELNYSRLPVYKNNLDEVVGMIHTKDIIPYLQQSDEFNWHTLMRTPYFVHENKLIDDLLKEFQSKHIHFAVVVDEFGGTSGIVTLEDVLEEIIGDIRDEFDDEESPNKKIDDNNYIFDGKTMLHDICKAMDLPLNTFDAVKGDSDSLAGLVLELAGEFPQLNEVVSSGDFDFTILEIDRSRIAKVKVTIKQRS